MVKSYDPEFAAIFGPIAEKMSKAPKSATGDVEGRRKVFNSTMAPMLASQPLAAGLNIKIHTYESPASANTSIKLFEISSETRLQEAEKTPAVLYLHGGGMIQGSAEIYPPFLGNYVKAASVPFFAVEYSLAPEARGPTQVQESYAALQWLHTNAERLNIDKTRIAVMGESAGAGLAAGLALYARDRGINPPLAKQILVYPMLDDRTIVPDPEIVDKITWSYGDNETGWRALRGSAFQAPDDKGYVCPSRATSLEGLPSAYIDVGDLDIFAKEDEHFAERLNGAGVRTQFELYPGLPHAFDFVASQGSFSKKAMANRVKVLSKL